ncbi:MAG: C4-dicarboxylate transporter DctA [Gemmatimonadota bacterium]|jgi:aerobic C4-dicarboxylate transport protein|nr:C4-dicarboxylate transporter DctA [Gemmatimonadota bacterium]
MRPPDPAAASAAGSAPPPTGWRRWAGNLTVQVLVAIAVGVLLGATAPETAKQMRLVGDTFVRLVRMVIGPVVFLTIVLGIASLRDLGTVGRVGLKALVYFEVVTTIALAIGLVVVNVTQPGAGLDAGALAKGDISAYANAGREAKGIGEFLSHVVPTSVVGAFAEGEILQIVFFAVLFGVALAGLGERVAGVVGGLEQLQEGFFRVVALVMRVAPIGAFGAMAYTVGSFGLSALLPLGRLMLDVYLTMAVFIFGVLGLVCRWFGFRLLPLLRYLRDELLLVLGTSSSEAALPRMLVKLERYGAAKPVVGLVIPAGYSFNLDGTSIYLSMAVVFIAQVFDVPLSIGQQLGILGVLMITSKGAAGVTGSGFVVLASTLAATRTVPLEGLALLLGVDRFMSEARAITNLIGNAVATLVVARSEGQFDDLKRTLADAEARGG